MPTRTLQVSAYTRRSPSKPAKYVETHRALKQEIEARDNRILAQMHDDLHQALIEDEILGEVAGMEMGRV